MTKLLEFLKENRDSKLMTGRYYDSADLLKRGAYYDECANLIKVGNGVLISTEVFQTNFTSKVQLEHLDETCEMETSPFCRNPGLDKLASVIDIYAGGFINLDAFMRQEISRSREDLLIRLEEKFLDITDWENPQSVKDNVDLVQKPGGYELKAFGTCLWSENPPHPVMNNWMHYIL